MDRVDSVVFLNGRYEALMEALHVRPEDTPRGLGGSIDGALRDLGLGVSDSVESASEAEFTLLLRLNFLRHALERAAVLVDIAASEPQVQAKRSQIFMQVKDLVKQSESEYTTFQNVQNDPSEMAVFRMNLDWTQSYPVDR